jgi:hypothetical protein
MRGHKRFKDGSWRLIVDAGKDPMTGKRRQIFRTVRAPNTTISQRHHGWTWNSIR